MTTINIQQWDTPVHCRRGTILEAALASGVPYPHNCRSGECGNCKSRLVAGQVDHDPYDPSALSDTERSAGMVLACRARPKTDVDVAWLAAVDPAISFPVRRVKASVLALEHATHDVVRLRLAVRGRPLAFAAGQYSQLSFGSLPARPYSMANRPDEAELEFHIRRVPNGVVSGHVTSELKVGDTARLEGPFGSSHLRQDHQGPIVAAAGGTGLAPIRSIVRTALKRMGPRPVHLYLGVRDERDVYAEDEIADIAAAYANVQTHIVLSDPAESTSRRTGFVHEAVAADLPSLRGAKVYVAGPPPMVNGVTDVALASGADRDDVHSDPFTPTVNGGADEAQSRLLVFLVRRLFGYHARGAAAAGNR